MNNFFIYSVGKIISSILKFLFLPVVSFYMTQEEVGEIGMILTIIPLLGLIINFGMNVNYSLKFYIFKENEKDILRVNILYFYIFIFLILLLLFFFKNDYIEKFFDLNKNKNFYIKLLSISFCSIVYEFLLEKYRMELNSKIYVIYQIINSSLIFLIPLFFILENQASISNYINGYFYSMVGSLLILLVRETKFKNIKLKRINISYLKESMKIGVIVMSNFFFSYLLTYIDRYILKEINGLKNVAMYTMGYKFGEVFNILIVSTYLLIVNPIFFKKYSFGEKEYKKKLNKIIDIFILISGIYFVSMSVGIKFIFHFLNKEYMNSIIITEIITLSYIFLGLSQLISSIILIKEKIRVTVIFTIIAGITNIILNYCWIPKYEAVGAALATMICYILILIISFLYSQRLLNLELIYENKIKIIIINVSFIFLIKLIDLENLYTDFILKIFIFFIYILMIYLLKLEPLINKYIRNKIKNI